MKRKELVEFATYNGIKGSSVKSNEALILELASGEIFTKEFIKEIQKGHNLKTLYSMCERFFTEKGEKMYNACFALRNFKIEPPVIATDVLTLNDLFKAKIAELFDTMDFEITRIHCYKSTNGVFGDASVRVYSNNIEKVTMIDSKIIHSNKITAHCLIVSIGYSSLRDDPWFIKSEEEYEEEKE